MRFIFFCVAILATSLTCPCVAQSAWDQLASIPNSGLERAFSFEIDGTIYVGNGRDASNSNQPTVWAYEVATDTWTQKADFPGASRRNAFAFALGNVAYMGTGFNGSSHLNDFWKYDSTSDSWTQLDDFPGAPRSHATAIPNDTVAYLLGGGRGGDNVYLPEMWLFNGNTETWEALDDYPGIGRWRIFGWIIDDKLYAGGGERFPDVVFQDFNSFDLATKAWEETERPDCPSTKTSGGYFFALRGKGYYCEGYNGFENSANDFGNLVYDYDPAANTWTQDIAFPGTARVLGFSAVVDEQAYVGGGRNFISFDFFNDVYTFTPRPSGTRYYERNDLLLTVYPNPVATTRLTVYGDFATNTPVAVSIVGVDGVVQSVARQSVRPSASNTIELNVHQLPPGLYQVELVQGESRGTASFVKR